MHNDRALGFNSEWLDGSSISPFNKSMCSEHFNVSTCPTHLKPTPLQNAVEHHPWIDLLPSSTMRDNILRLGDEYDDTPLCQDLVEICDRPGQQAGLIVWGDPWDPHNWEVSEEFLRKWGWVIRNCWELLSATNHWRTKRGERKLFPDSLCTEVLD